MPRELVILELRAERRQLARELRGVEQQLDNIRRNANTALDGLTTDAQNLRSKAVGLTQQLGAVDAKLSNVRTTSRQLGVGVRQMSAEIPVLGGVVGALTTKMGAAGLAIGAAGVAMGLAAKEYAAFEAAVVKAAAVMQATSVQQTALATTSAHLGRTTAFTAGQAAQGLVLLGQAGLNVTESIAALPGVINLALAGMINTNDAASSAARALNMFQLSADSMNRVVDTAVGTFTNSNVTIGDWTSSLSFAGSTAASAGLSIEATSAIIGILGDNGVKASKAGTGLRGSIASLVGPSRNQARVLSELNVQVFKTDGTMRNFVDVMADLRAAGVTLPQIFTLFGREAGNSAQIIIENIPEIRRFTKTLEESGGAAQTMADRNLDTLKGSFILLKSAVNGVAIELGQKLAPGIRSIMDELRQVLAPTNEWRNSVDPLAQALTDVYENGKQIPPWLNDHLNKAIKDARGETDQVTGSFTSMNTVMNASWEVLEKQRKKLVETNAGLTLFGQTLYDFRTAAGEAKGEQALLLVQWRQADELVKLVRLEIDKQTEALSKVDKGSDEYHEIQAKIQRLRLAEVEALQGVSDKHALLTKEQKEAITTYEQLEEDVRFYDEQLGNANHTLAKANETLIANKAAEKERASALWESIKAAKEADSKTWAYDEATGDLNEALTTTQQKEVAAKLALDLRIASLMNAVTQTNNLKQSTTDLSDVTGDLNEELSVAAQRENAARLATATRHGWMIKAIDAVKNGATAQSQLNKAIEEGHPLTAAFIKQLIALENDHLKKVKEIMQAVAEGTGDYNGALATLTNMGIKNAKQMLDNYLASVDAVTEGTKKATKATKEFQGILNPSGEPNPGGQPLSTGGVGYGTFVGSRRLGSKEEQREAIEAAIAEVNKLKEEGQLGPAGYLQAMLALISMPVIKGVNVETDFVRQILNEAGFSTVTGFTGGAKTAAFHQLSVMDLYGYEHGINADDYGRYKDNEHGEPVFSWTNRGGYLAAIEAAWMKFLTEWAPTMSVGGIIQASPGGTMVRAAEAGVAEAIIPLNRMPEMGLGSSINLEATIVANVPLDIEVAKVTQAAARRGRGIMESYNRPLSENYEVIDTL